MEALQGKTTVSRSIALKVREMAHPLLLKDRAYLKCENSMVMSGFDYRKRPQLAVGRPFLSFYA